MNTAFLFEKNTNILFLFLKDPLHQFNKVNTTIRWYYRHTFYYYVLLFYTLQKHAGNTKGADTRRAKCHTIRHTTPNAKRQTQNIYFSYSLLLLRTALIALRLALHGELRGISPVVYQRLKRRRSLRQDRGSGPLGARLSLVHACDVRALGHWPVMHWGTERD